MLALRAGCLAAACCPLFGAALGYWWPVPAGPYMIPDALLSLAQNAFADRLRRRRCKPVKWEAASLCPQGNERWSADELRAALPDFARLYAGRPLRRNGNGMNTNHAFSLFFTVQALKPRHIIESGAYRGQSTWIIRQAAGPDAMIYVIDPYDHLVYRDDASGRTRYFVGRQGFKDFGDIDWTSLIPASERPSTLVVIDDHQSILRRMREILRNGFSHVWTDDNDKHLTGDYSFNLLCTPLPEGAGDVIHHDHFAWSRARISAEEHRANLDYLLGHLETYFEFPPIIDGCGRVPNPLLANESELAALGFPSVEQDEYLYWSKRPPYVKLRP